MKLRDFRRLHRGSYCYGPLKRKVIILDKPDLKAETVIGRYADDKTTHEPLLFHRAALTIYSNRLRK